MITVTLTEAISSGADTLCSREGDRGRGIEVGSAFQHKGHQTQLREPPGP